MFRRAIAILSLMMLLLAGTGILYVYSTAVAHRVAESLSIASLEQNQDVEYLTLTHDEFVSLTKKQLHSGVFEICWKGNRYDVYQTTTSGNNTVNLLVRNDSFEQQNADHYRDKNTSKPINIAAPFYIFSFFEQPSAFQHYFTAVELTEYTIVYSSFGEKQQIPGPPPDLS